MCPLTMASSMFTAFKYPQRLDKCRICALLDQDGETEGLYEDHLTDNPVGCPLFANMNIQTNSNQTQTEAKTPFFHPKISLKLKKLLFPSTQDFRLYSSIKYGQNALGIC